MDSINENVKELSLLEHMTTVSDCLHSALLSAAVSARSGEISDSAREQIRDLVTVLARNTDKLDPDQAGMWPNGKEESK